MVVIIYIFNIITFFFIYLRSDACFETSQHRARRRAFRDNQYVYRGVDKNGIENAMHMQGDEREKQSIYAQNKTRQKRIRRTELVSQSQQQQRCDRTMGYSNRTRPQNCVHVRYSVRQWTEKDATSLRSQ